MNKLEIVGVSSYIPDKKVTNDDLSKIMDTSDEWILSRTGISSRYYSLNLNTSQMAIKASIDVIDKYKIDPNEIGLVLVCTMTPDNITPSVSCQILSALNIKEAMAFDINCACSGFVYGLNIASSLVENNDYKYALVIGVEKLSKILDYNDRSTSILFGDGAGACIIKKTQKKAYFTCLAYTDEMNVLNAKGIDSKGLFLNSSMDNYYLTMNGPEVYKFAISSSVDVMNKVLNKANMTYDDIALIIPHQANIRIIEAIRKRLNLSSDKFYTNVCEYGNTSAASIPIALSEIYDKKILKKGDKIILVGFGSGLTYAASIIEI